MSNAECRFRSLSSTKGTSVTMNNDCLDLAVTNKPTDFKTTISKFKHQQARYYTITNKITTQISLSMIYKELTM